MARYPSSYNSYSIGPGGISPAVRTLIVANVVMFVLQLIVEPITLRLGLQPSAVFHQLALWQLVTYMFLHGGLSHIIFNMLALWMFGTELERTWGTRFFVKYYLITGIGAALTCLLLSISPFSFAPAMYNSVTIGASGAIYGLLIAYGMYFPTRTIYYIIFPIPARYFVMLAGLLVFINTVGGSGRSGVADAAHLGGLVVGYLYLKGLRMRPMDELKYRWLRWRMGRARSKFDVYSGGRSSDDDDWKREWKKHIH